MKLLFITGSRGEWGYIRPILRLCQREQVEYSLCVTNMHVLPAFGLSSKDIEADGFHVDHTVYMALDGYNHFTMVKSLGIFLLGLVDIVAARRPDWVVLAGDRGEQLIGAMVGAHCYVPVAHIQAGEVSGNIDGMTRHAIGKYAHLHLAANQDAADRLHRLGEEPFRIHNVGAPQLDELVEGLYSSPAELVRNLGIDVQEPYLLVVQHPVTEEASQAREQARVTMDALRDIDCTKVVVMPNNDAGSQAVRDAINDHRSGRVHVFANLRREDFLGLLRHSACLIGNSSAGLLEAPTFRVPAVNIGRRQAMRVRGTNVLDVAWDVQEIRAAITRAMSDGFRDALQRECENPYGDGRSAERILRLLKGTPRDDRLLIKSLTY